MADMRSKLNELYSLEQLSNKNTIIHKIHPMIKIIVTIVYIVCLLMKNRYDLFGLAVFLFYPIIVMALAEIPYKMIFNRTLVTLPFVFFAGIGSLIFDREEVILASGVVVTTGVLAFFVLHVRTILSVSAVLLLVSTTKFSDLTEQLGRMHVPTFMIHLMEMIYRYITVLVEEASVMMTAYRLRNPKYKYPHIKHMGTFVGHLFLRSMDRAERIYCAMKCRAYGKDVMKNTKSTENTESTEITEITESTESVESIESTESGDSMKDMLKIENLTVKYPDGKLAVDNFSLSVESGKKVALVGANGAGKSTLMLAIEGLLEGEGSIFVDGMVLNKENLADIRQRVGMVFQNPDDQLFMANIYDDIAFGPRNMGLDEESVRYRVEDRLKLLGISNLRDKTALKMSGGEKRMAAMATVLAMKPSVMLLDEPTAFLDPKARRTLINVLNTLPHTMLIATHDLAFAKEVCEHVVVMKEGRVFAEGSCVDILYDEKLMDEGGLESIR